MLTTAKTLKDVAEIAATDVGINACHQVYGYSKVIQTRSDSWTCPSCEERIKFNTHKVELPIHHEVMVRCGNCCGFSYFVMPIIENHNTWK